MKLVPGQPCAHPACLSHVRSPCEGCGRRGGFFTPRTELIEKVQTGFQRLQVAVQTANEAFCKLVPIMQELERQMEERAECEEHEDPRWRGTR